MLAQASIPQQVPAIGKQGGGRVWLFQHSDNFVRDYAAITAHGMLSLEALRHEPYGNVAVFEDLCGNRWDLRPNP